MADDDCPSKIKEKILNNILQTCGKKKKKLWANYLNNLTNKFNLLYPNYALIISDLVLFSVHDVLFFNRVQVNVVKSGCSKIKLSSI